MSNSRVRGVPDAGALNFGAVILKSALGCDAVVVSWFLDDGDVLIGSCGLSDDEMTTLQTSSLLDRAGSDLARELGFESHLALPMSRENVEIGTCLAVNHHADGGLDEKLAATVSSYLATALGRPAKRRGQRAQPGFPWSAVDQIGLSAANFTELRDDLDRALSTEFGEVRVGLMVWDERRALLEMVTGSFGAPDDVTSGHSIDLKNRTNIGLIYSLIEAHAAGRPVSDHPFLAQYRDAFGIEHLISAPLGDGNSRSTGILHIARCGRRFSARDVDRCDTVISRVRAAVESTRIMMLLSQQKKFEEVLSRQAFEIASGAVGNESLLRCLEQLRRLLRASVVAVVPKNAAPLIVTRPAAPDVAVQWLVDEARNSRHVGAFHAAVGSRGDPHSATLLVPVRLGTEFIGALVAARERLESFTAEEHQGMSRMAELIALGWASEQYQHHRDVLARLEERQRIADDLHEDVAQILFAAQIHLDTLLEQQAVPDHIRSQALAARQLIVRSDAEIRALMTKLSRPLAAGLPERLYEVIDLIEEDFGLPVRLEIDERAAKASRQVGRAVTETMVKVAREALTNAAKHAGPCRTRLTLKIVEPDRLHLRVSDDGAVRSSRSAESHGLTSIRRSVRRLGGSLMIRRLPGGGTVVTASLPL